MKNSEDLSMLIDGITSLVSKYEKLGFSIIEGDEEKKREWKLSKDDEAFVEIELMIGEPKLTDVVYSDNSPLSAYHVDIKIELKISIGFEKETDIVKNLFKDISYLTEHNMNEDKLIVKNKYYRDNNKVH